MQHRLTWNLTLAIVIHLTTPGNLGSVLRKGNSANHRIVTVSKLSKQVQKLAKLIFKFSIFELKSLFVSCEFNIPGVIAIHVLLWHLKKSLSGE